MPQCGAICHADGASTGLRNAYGQFIVSNAIIVETNLYSNKRNKQWKYLDY